MDDDMVRKHKSRPSKKKNVAKKVAGPRGFKRTKTQISVRLEDSVLALAQQLAKLYDEGLTDFVESGIWAEVSRRLTEPPKTRIARFLILRATPLEQEIVTDVLGFLRMPHDALQDNELFEVYEAYRAGWLKMLAVAKRLPDFEKALASYGEMPSVVKSEAEDLRTFFKPLLDSGKLDVQNSPNEL